MTSQNSLEVCLIDAGIKTLRELDIPDAIVNLNLHCNEIKTIENISHLCKLKYMDLSSNNLTKMSGISSCFCLQKLNLACNQINVVEGLEELSSLKQLNLSFNRIHDLYGLKSVKKATHCLTHLELYSNRVSSLHHVIDCLRKCTSIQSVHLRKGTNTNPVCVIPAYRPNLLSQLPWLQNLDGFDKYGNKAEDCEAVNDIPGLDEFMRILEASPSSKYSTNVTTSVDDNSSYGDVITPKIDNVLLKFKHRQNKTSPLSPTDNFEKHNNKTEVNNAWKPTVVNDRLLSLEEKLIKLTELYTEHRLEEHSKKSLVDITSNESSTAEFSWQNVNNDELCVETRNKSNSWKNEQQKGNVALETGKEKKTKTLQVNRVKKQVGQSNSNKQRQNAPLGNRMVRSAEDDEIYLNLMHEIDVERERRWKAEQATRKLLDGLKSIKDTLTEERKIQEAAVVFNAKLKQSLEKEREARKHLEESLRNLEEENEALRSNLKKIEEAHGCDRRLLKELQDSSLQLEKDSMEKEMHHKKQLKELQLNSGGCQRELEMLTNTALKQKEQLQQLQELLVVKEQEHRLALENKVTLDGKEVQEIVEKEILKCEAKNKCLIDQHLLKFHEKTMEYAALEDEFRMALEIEANRYNKLQEISEETNCQFHELKSSFEDVSKEEAKAKGLVAELSMVVKEQKFKISEMLRSKNDIQNAQKSQMSRVDEELIALRKIASKFESMRQDKERMATHIKGQESIILGLRSERKLWGQELAHQGASLAQERGKLDVLVDRQKQNIQQLHLQIAEMDDSLKIKAKLIDSQTNTIRKMKEDLLKMSEENKKLANEEQEIRNTLDEELNDTKISCRELQDNICELTERKEELKNIVADLEHDLKQSKSELRDLRAKWNERSKMINDLEGKVVKMKNKFEEKEKQLSTELKDMQEQLKISNNCIHEMKASYERDLLAKEHESGLKLRKAVTEKDNEIQQAKQRVMGVEEEMRVLLTETAAQKKHLEQRVNNLSKAFTDIENDLK